MHGRGRNVRGQNVRLPLKLDYTFNRRLNITHEYISIILHFYNLSYCHLNFSPSKELSSYISTILRLFSDAHVTMVTLKQAFVINLVKYLNILFTVQIVLLTIVIDTRFVTIDLFIVYFNFYLHDFNSDVGDIYISPLD